MSAYLWPREAPRFTHSEAETRVYEALRSGLPEGWRAWHSLRLRSRSSGQFDEADFLLADPSKPSLLIIEVKGGHIEMKDGRWYQNDRLMDPPPLDQAFAFRSVLVERLRDRNLNPPKIGCAICFPDTVFEKGPCEDSLQCLVIGGKDLPYLKQVLPTVMNLAVPDPWDTSNAWVDAIHQFWGETWIPTLGLGGRVRLAEEKRLQLDREQAALLENLEENDRLLVRGPAGTGKTLLACEAALRQARQGKRVLFLCYTDALAAALRALLKDSGVTVGAVREFAVSLLGEHGPEKLIGRPSEYWETVSLRAAVDGLPAKEERWDGVIVDEGQDFGGDDWELVKECVRPGGRLWVFADKDQAFWGDRGVPEEMIQGFAKYALTTPYRCHPAIQHLDECYAGQCRPDFQVLRSGVKDETIRIVTSSEGKLIKQIGKEINRLLTGGLQPSHIAVLSLRGRGSEESIIHEKTIGGHQVVLATDAAAADRIVCDTFLRFKGLERPAVIITDFRLVRDLYEKRMHIAVSRALSFLRVVGVEAEIKKDPVLAKLV